METHEPKAEPATRRRVRLSKSAGLSAVAPAGISSGRKSPFIQAPGAPLDASTTTAGQDMKSKTEHAPEHVWVNSKAEEKIEGEEGERQHEAQEDLQSREEPYSETFKVVSEQKEASAPAPCPVEIAAPSHPRIPGSPLETFFPSFLF